MQDITCGQVVYSKSGRDKGFPFIILSLDGEYAYLVDGKRHTLTKAKKKKHKHIQPINFIEQEIAQKIGQKAFLTDSEIQKVLKPYTK